MYFEPCLQVLSLITFLFRTLRWTGFTRYHIHYPGMCSRHNFLYLCYDFVVFSKPEYVESRGWVPMVLKMLSLNQTSFNLFFHSSLFVFLSLIFLVLIVNVLLCGRILVACQMIFQYEKDGLPKRLAC